MKFLHKINRIYFKSFLIVLITLSILSYFALRILIIEETKEKLFEKEHIVIEQIKNDSILPNFYPFLEVNKSSKNLNQKKKFKTVYIENKLEENELEPYIEYSNQIKVNNINYSLKIRQSTLENNELLWAVALLLLSVLFITSILAFIINKNLTKRVWEKFEKNLLQISEFNFNDDDTLQLTHTRISEFDHLNEILLTLTNKLNKDYNNIKEFADNASHEIQTPLTVITMNLETLLQEKLPQKITEKLYVCYQYANRLQKLNKSLLLLSKIDNHQFKNTETINLSKLLEDKITSFQPLIQSKNIKLKLKLNKEFFISIDPLLADTLVNNLLSNAINHNIESGFITISIDDNKIIISNSTPDILLNEDELFNRFKKGNTISESVGLGLAIVKKITDIYDLNIYLKHSINIMFVTLSR